MIPDVVVKTCSTGADMFVRSHFFEIMDNGRDRAHTLYNPTESTLVWYSGKYFFFLSFLFHDFATCKKSVDFGSHNLWRHRLNWSMCVTFQSYNIYLFILSFLSLTNLFVRLISMVVIRCGNAVSGPEMIGQFLSALPPTTHTIKAFDAQPIEVNLSWNEYTRYHNSI